MNETLIELAKLGEQMRNHPISEILRCKAYECPKTATEGYPSCSKEHGYELSVWREIMEEIDYADNFKATPSYRPPYTTLVHEPIGKINYYFKRYEFSS